MIEGLSGITGQLATLGLDISLQRHEWIAHNIANSSTPGFVGKDIDFGSILERAATALDGSGNTLENTAAAKAHFADLRQRLNAGDYVTERLDQPVEVDDELVELTANTLHYQAILTAVAKRGSMLAMAVKGGRF